ncbi:type II toxin-antitoxin system prevent-host-death family antitoxin [Rhizobium sp. HT1-10]|uniref:type II toxin-antitoxin system prevent-host-death family antitoxin n=1 Tax=Rhizobium sp. HT1-10 TaxID=3111638 RepID=UPI003C2102FA
MSMTTSVEFKRRFEDFQNEARREPVEIMSDGQRNLVLMSAEHYDWMTAAAKRTHRTEDLSDVIVKAVEMAEMDLVHSDLDRLLK